MRSVVYALLSKWGSGGTDRPTTHARLIGFLLELEVYALVFPRF